MQKSVKKNLPCHILVKLPPSGDDRFKTKSVAEAHNEIADQLGTAWFGKSGRGFSETIMNNIKKSLRDGRVTYLIVLCGPQKRRAFIAAKIKSVLANNFPAARQIPMYYREMKLFIKQWIEIGKFEEMTDSDLAEMVVASSGRPVNEVALRCQAPYMMVCMKDDMAKILKQELAEDNDSERKLVSKKKASTVSPKKSLPAKTRGNDA
jgi:hypothetical protein